MSEKLYTLAEAIVKIQSGEWKAACFVGESGTVYILKPNENLNLESCELGKPGHSYFYFSKVDEKIWEEYKPEIPFDKSSDEALIGIFNRCEIWERKANGGAIVSYKTIDGVLFYTIIGLENKSWNTSYWGVDKRDSKWRKAENQEVEG